MRLRRTVPLGTGARDRHVTIQAANDGDSGSGFPSDVWTDLATVAMAREDVEAVETDRTTQELAIGTTRWEMPYRADMDPEQVDVPKARRLLYRDRVYDIIAAVPLGQQRTIELLTSASSKTPT